MQFKATPKNYLLLEKGKESSRISISWRRKDLECMRKKKLVNPRDEVSSGKSKTSRVAMVIVTAPSLMAPVVH